MTTRPHFLNDPPRSLQVDALMERDLADYGYVMNLTKLWAFQPQIKAGLFDLLMATTRAGELSLRQRGIMVTAMASTLGDSYCSLAWGLKLANETDEQISAGVLLGKDTELTSDEQALAQWTRKVTGSPNSIEGDDIEAMRDAGFSDEQIFAATVYIALRIAFSTVNDALGAVPDAALRTTAPPTVLEAVQWGRPIGE